jgi:hypothetical protein
MFIIFDKKFWSGRLNINHKAREKDYLLTQLKDVSQAYAL